MLLCRRRRTQRFSSARITRDAPSCTRTIGSSSPSSTATPPTSSTTDSAYGAAARRGLLGAKSRAKTGPESEPASVAADERHACGRERSV